MKDHESELKIQAFLDGELPESEAREVAAWLAQDGDAAGLMAELKNTRQALAGFDQSIKVPESREFYWSKIQREIERMPMESAPAPTVSWLAQLRRMLIPATALALVCLAGVVALRQGASPAGVETAVATPGAFTYRDFNSGTTLVWLPYPAEDQLAARY